MATTTARRSTRFFPSISRAVQKIEWVAMYGVAPITTDETTIGKIVSFVMAARNLLIEEPLAERTRLLKLLIEAGTEMRRMWLDGNRQDAREGEDAVRLIELGEAGSGSRTRMRRKP